MFNVSNKVYKPTMLCPKCQSYDHKAQYCCNDETGEEWIKFTCKTCGYMCSYQTNTPDLLNDEDL